LSRAELTSFSHVVLILVGRNGAGPHDLARMARQGRIYGDFAGSQWYAEPTRLAKLGYLSARKEPGKTRERTHYELTPKGREALEIWIRQPTPFSRIQLEPAWRLLAADLVGEEAVLASLEGLRTEIADLTARLDEMDEAAVNVPHRERYLRLNHRLGRKIVQAHAEWLDEVERELGR
jgi:PadR family transcriptional regulator AphA